MSDDAFTLAAKLGDMIERVARLGGLSKPDLSDSYVKAKALLFALTDCQCDDLRAAGWTVAVHNDYRLNDQPHTFWLLTRGTTCVKGEGRTDAEALNAIRAELALREAATDAT